MILSRWYQPPTNQSDLMVKLCSLRTEGGGNSGNGRGLPYYPTGNAKTSTAHAHKGDRKSQVGLRERHLFLYPPQEFLETHKQRLTKRTVSALTRSCS